MCNQAINNDLESVIAQFKPNLALTNLELEKYYVTMDQNEILIEELKCCLKISFKTHQPVKLLFMGHSGSGKSTALNHLVSILNKQNGTNYLIVKYDVLELLDSNDLDYADVLFSVLSNIVAEAQKNEIIIKSSTVESLTGWGKNITVTNIFEGRDESVIGIKFTAYLFGILSKMRSETTTRKEIREELHPHVSELIAIINDVIEEVEKSGKQVLVIIDNLEKCAHNKILDLFYYNSNQLAQPKCNIIYTFPISLRSSIHFNVIRSNFDDVIIFPNITINDRDGVHNSGQEGRKFMREVAERRVSLDLFTPDALDYLIEMSGGVIREYIRIIRSSAISARSRRKSLIDKQIAIQTINNLKNTYYILQFSETDYPVLKEVFETKEIKRDEKLMDLLHNLCVLEYKDEQAWCDLNPIVLSILEQKGIIKVEELNKNQ